MAEDSLLYGERNGEGDPCTCFLLDDSLMSGSPAWTNLCFFCEEGLTLIHRHVLGGPGRGNCAGRFTTASSD